MSTDKIYVAAIQENHFLAALSVQLAFLEHVSCINFSFQCLVPNRFLKSSLQPTLNFVKFIYLLDASKMLNIFWGESNSESQINTFTFLLHFLNCFGLERKWLYNKVLSLL